MGILPVRTDVPQKASDETDPGSGLGHDLAASVETTYSEQSSSCWLLVFLWPAHLLQVEDLASNHMTISNKTNV